MEAGVRVHTSAYENRLAKAEAAASARKLSWVALKSDLSNWLCYTSRRSRRITPNDAAPVGRNLYNDELMAYVCSAVAIVSFGALGLTYKLSDRLGCDKAQVNLALFLSAGAAALIWAAATGGLAALGRAAALGVAMGSISFCNITAFRQAAAKGRISTSWTVINLSLVIPVAASVFIWSEVPAPRHYLGFALILAAIALLGMDLERARE